MLLALGLVYCVPGGGHLFLQQPAHLPLAPRHIQPGGASLLQGRLPQSMIWNHSFPQCCGFLTVFRIRIHRVRLPIQTTIWRLKGAVSWDPVSKHWLVRSIIYACVRSLLRIYPYDLEVIQSRQGINCMIYHIWITEMFWSGPGSYGLKVPSGQIGSAWGWYHWING